MKRIVCLIALVVALGAFPAVGKADTLVFIGTLTGAQEVPPAASPGIGFAVVTFDTVAHTLTVNVTFSGLVSPTTVSHIHCCAPPGTNAGVATPVPTFPGFPAGVQDGSYTNTFDLTNISSFNPAFITAREVRCLERKRHSLPVS
ncbi:MAG TPA: CHRD domain-containing protein [Pyrinomonadaceae bacterium]|nr:CHRD domain-containing protein [Pyrinomonadaceae bacterium]